MKFIFGLTLAGLTLALLSLGASAQSHLGQSSSPAPFQQLAELTGAEPGSGFGRSVAISGNTMVVGVPSASDVCGGCGAAYVYSASDGDWSSLVQVATLTQSGALGGSIFGGPVAISSDTIVVGGFDVTTGEPAAFVYINPVGLATQTAELTVSGGGNAAQEIFGVGIDGDTIVVGMPLVSLGGNLEQGTAYVYVEPAEGWANMTQTAQLVATDGAGSIHFGTGVAISGRNIVVGAPGAKPAGGLTGQGMVYLFVEPSAGWSGIRGQTTELKASDPTRDAGLGVGVSVSGDIVAAGAPEQVINSHQAEGAVYAFARPSGGWPKVMTQTAELTVANGTSREDLGNSVTITKRVIAAGAPAARGGQGVTYIFLEPSGGWQNSSKADAIVASDAASGAQFGWCLATGGSVLAVCSTGWPDGGSDADGAVYVFSLGR